MKILCVFGKYNYGDPQRGCSAEYSAFIPAFKNLGNEVEHFDSWDRSAFNDFRQLNEALLKKIQNFRPRLMFTVQTHFELWLETLRIIKNRGDVATVSWATDDSWKYGEVSRFIGRAYHAMVTTYPAFIRQYHADGIAQVLPSQWAATGNLLREPRETSSWQYPVSFIGTANTWRVERIAELARAGIQVHCFGYDWPAGPVVAEKIPEIVNNSGICLNFADSHGVNQIKARTFEVPGAGSLLFTEPAQNLESFFREDAEIIIFRSDREMIEKIRFFLEHPGRRNEVAMAGFQRTRDCHTYEKRLREVVEFTLKAHEHYVPHPESVPKADLKKTCRAHRAGYFLRFQRDCLLLLCRAIFGEKRAPRAARKLVFEISRRLLGEKTFSAAGLPGRLFYHAS